MHRLAHHPRLYRGHYKEHHEYTNQLTALVLYHGALLDDFLMPVTTTVGGALYILLLSLVGLEERPSQRERLLGDLQHAALPRARRPLRTADGAAARLAQLRRVPLRAPPEPVEQLRPHRASDIIWDRILGVSTVRKPGFTAKPKVL